MSESHFMMHITAHEADQKAHLAAGRLVEFLTTFNKEHPDPEAEAVSDHFDYFTQNYIVQTCASILAERFVVLPQQIEWREH